jgi:hypothetical protein
MFKIIFIGFYQLFKWTIYWDRHDPFFGALEHSFMFSMIIHVMNIHTITRILAAKYLHSYVGFEFMLAIILVLGTLVYLFCYRNGWLKKVIGKHRENKFLFLFGLVSIVYLAMSVYLMFCTGDYIKVNYSF